MSTSPDTTAREWTLRSAHRRSGSGGDGNGGDGVDGDDVCCGRVVRGLHNAWTRGCAITADGALAATAGYDGVVCLWEAGDAVREGLESVLASVRREGYEHANGCAMTPDGRFVVATFYKDKGMGGEVVIGEVSKVRGVEGLSVAITAYTWEKSNLRECCVSGDGSVVGLTSWRGSGGQWYVDVIAVRTGGLLRPSVKVRGKFPAVAMTAAGDYVIVADDAALAVWAVHAARSEASVMQGYAAPRSKHCAVTPRGDRIVAAVAENMFAVWDRRSGEMIARLSGHGAAGRGCAVSVCGTRFVTCCGDAAVRFFDVGAVLEGLAQRTVSKAEARAWFRVAVQRCGSEGTLSYQKASLAVHSLLLNAGHASRRWIAPETLEDILEGVDRGATERICEDGFARTFAAVSRHLGIAGVHNLSENWWVAFEQAADSLKGRLSKRQARRILLRVAQEERGVEGMSARSTEQDAVVADAKLAAAEANVGGRPRNDQKFLPQDSRESLFWATDFCARGFSVDIALYIEIASGLMFGDSDGRRKLIEEGICPRSGCSSPIRSSGSVDVSEEENAADTICVICQSEFVLGDTLLRLPACGHEYHADCLRKYVKSTKKKGRRQQLVCPIDREPIILLWGDNLDCLPRRRYLPTA